MQVSTPRLTKPVTCQNRRAVVDSMELKKGYNALYGLVSSTCVAMHGLEEQAEVSWQQIEAVSDSRVWAMSMQVTSMGAS